MTKLLSFLNEGPVQARRVGNGSRGLRKWVLGVAVGTLAAAGVAGGLAPSVMSAAFEAWKAGTFSGITKEARFRGAVTACRVVKAFSSDSAGVSNADGPLIDGVEEVYQIGDSAPWRNDDKTLLASRCGEAVMVSDGTTEMHYSMSTFRKEFVTESQMSGMFAKLLEPSAEVSVPPPVPRFVVTADLQSPPGM